MPALLIMIIVILVLVPGYHLAPPRRAGGTLNLFLKRIIFAKTFMGGKYNVQIINGCHNYDEGPIVEVVRTKFICYQDREEIMFFEFDGEPMIEAFFGYDLFLLCLFAAGERLHKQGCNCQRP